MTTTLYGQTDIEQHFESAKKCRDIVHEIIRFGVTQEQLARIIYLLSLELEDNETMRVVSVAAKRLWDPLDDAAQDQPSLLR